MGDVIEAGAASAKRAVVTGASSGIGAASVRALVKAGWTVVALARRVAKLKALVNCAGAAFGKDPVATASLDDWRGMYELNVIGTLRITQKLLPALKRAPGGGTVLVISSTAGIEPYEGGAGYCASKFAERVMARVLRLEQIGEPVRVIDIAPGMVETDEFSLKRFGGDAQRAAAVYAGVPSPLKAEDIAECVTWALAQPDTVDIDQIVVRPRAEGSYTKVYRER